MTGVTKTLEKLLGVISAAVLFLMMIITTVDVFGRYVLNKPLPGGFEMTEMALAVLIYAALPLVSIRREHIVIDTLDTLMSPWDVIYLCDDSDNLSKNEIKEIANC